MTSLRSTSRGMRLTKSRGIQPTLVSVRKRAAHHPLSWSMRTMSSVSPFRNGSWSGSSGLKLCRQETRKVSSRRRDVRRERLALCVRVFALARRRKLTEDALEETVGVAVEGSGERGLGVMGVV